MAFNEKELNSVKLSATKKDFYQVWNELLETAGKLSTRWDPTSTNESDPGVVLLKVLAAVADKLSYTGDKRILEIYMPSAAEEASMKKLCDMLGYSMKYYQSATTDVTISYVGTSKLPADGYEIPAYTNIKDNDDTINYFTLENIIMDNDVNKTRVVKCMEGAVVLCGDDTNNIITIEQLDDGNRYYLPETQIAENGIFIKNINDETVGELWERVDNLNTQQVGKHCFKLGFDSQLQMPYIQFPEDIGSIIEDGLIIRYTRTNGINGNIAYNVLSTIELQTGGKDDETTVTSTDFVCKNKTAALNGRNKETINDAYNNYKRTIGTFDTLTTCRDYINKIYTMTVSETDTTPLVSNIVVSDIRDDINRAVTLCTFNESGICYVDKPLLSSECIEAIDEHGDIVNIKTNRINHFDLVLYPFTTISGSVLPESFKNSFKYTNTANAEIMYNLEESKTISHHFLEPKNGDIACIKNYLKLNARITTTYKVNAVEEAGILTNIYAAIYENFNARKVDFGDEIPFDTILEVIENADTRIKNVSLDEPILYTKFCFVNGSEHDVTENLGKIAYNKLALRNVLAGRVNLFDYNTDFTHDLNEAKAGDLNLIYENVSKIETSFNIASGSHDIELKENEVVQFRAPNFKTTNTYPAYVNYYLHLDSSLHGGKAAIAANFDTLLNYMNGTGQFSGQGEKWEDATANAGLSGTIIVVHKSGEGTPTIAELRNLETQHGAIFTYDENEEAYTRYIIDPNKTIADINYYALPMTESTFPYWVNYIKGQPTVYTGGHLKGIYRNVSTDISKTAGEYVDELGRKFRLLYEFSGGSMTPFQKVFVQKTWASDNLPENGGTKPYYVKEGIGRALESAGIKTDSDYELAVGEYLLINYTPSTTNESSTPAPISKVIGAGTIIRPNFELVDSAEYKTAGHTPTKKDADFTKEGTTYQQAITAIGGMYTLGTSEQIEIREKNVITLDDIVANIYWELNNETAVDNTIEFPFGRDENDPDAYTLKDGEYFYWTNDNKLDLVYYGAGTRIVRANSGFKLSKPKADSVKLAEKIANEGLLAGIPWKQYNLSTNNIHIQDYQYLTLAEGDILISTENDAESITEIKNDWESLDSGYARYKLAGSDVESKLPEIKCSGVQWEVRSHLNLNLGPATAQTLHNTDKISITYGDNATEDITVDNSIAPTIKSNVTIQSTESTLENLDIKLSVYTVDTTIYSNLRNFGTNGGWTKISCKELVVGGAAAPAKINVSIPKNHHALLLFHYAGEHLTQTASGLTVTGCTLKIFNADITSSKFDNNGWWTGKHTTDKYYLRPGINIVEVIPTTTSADSTCTITVYPDAINNPNGVIIISQPDLVAYTATTGYAINPTIAYIADASSTVSADILSDIRAIDTDYNFYYNAILDAATALDINTAAEETLSSERIWYDYNNLNNKFVISEIDIDYLKDGIKLTNSSRK